MEITLPVQRFTRNDDNQPYENNLGLSEKDK